MIIRHPNKNYELAFGPRRLPNVATTLTNRLLYWILLLARPVRFFFFSCASTFGVCPRTLPARAKEPWTFPPKRGTVTSTAQFSRLLITPSSDNGLPENTEGYLLNFHARKFELGVPR